jgi:hypothetical protein
MYSMQHQAFLGPCQSQRTFCSPLSPLSPSGRVSCHLLHVSHRIRICYFMSPLVSHILLYHDHLFLPRCRCLMSSRLRFHLQRHRRMECLLLSLALAWFEVHHRRRGTCADLLPLSDLYFELGRLVSHLALATQLLHLDKQSLSSVASPTHLFRICQEP